MQSLCCCAVGTCEWPLERWLVMPVCASSWLTRRFLNINILAETMDYTLTPALTFSLYTLASKFIRNSSYTVLMSSVTGFFFNLCNWPQLFVCGCCFVVVVVFGGVVVVVVFQ